AAWTKATSGPRTVSGCRDKINPDSTPTHPALCSSHHACNFEPSLSCTEPCLAPGGMCSTTSPHTSSRRAPSCESAQNSSAVRSRVVVLITVLTEIVFEIAFYRYPEAG